VSDEQMRDWLERARKTQAAMDEMGVGRPAVNDWSIVARVGTGNALHAARRQKDERGLVVTVTRCGQRFSVFSTPSAKGYGPSCRRCLQLLARDQPATR